MSVPDDPVKLRRETLEISDGRKLYLYTFEIDDEGPEPSEGRRYPDDPEAAPAPNAADQGSEPND